MFVLVRLSNSRKVIVPMKWILGFNENMAKQWNYGVNYSKRNEYKIFVSNNFNEDPDFTTCVLVALNECRSGCYNGSVLKCFGNEIITHSINNVNRSDNMKESFYFV